MLEITAIGLLLLLPLEVKRPRQPIRQKNIVYESYGCLFNTIDNVDRFRLKLSLSKSLIARLQ